MERDPSLEMLNAEQWREKRIELQAKALDVPEHSGTASGRFTLSSKHLNEKEIDRVIARFKEIQDPSDFSVQERQVKQPVFRIRYLCIQSIMQASQMKGQEMDEDDAAKYMDGLSKKRFGRTLMELGKDDALKVLKMLETHRIRLEKRIGQSEMVGAEPF